MARFLKSIASAILFGNGNVDLETGTRGDNSIVVYHAHSVNSVKSERMLNSFLESKKMGARFV